MAAGQTPPPPPATLPAPPGAAPLAADASGPAFPPPPRMDPPPVWPAGLAAACAFGCSLLTQSLREYSRAALAKACGDLGVSGRLTAILQGRDDVLVVLRGLAFLLNAAALVLFALACGLPLPGVPGTTGGWAAAGEWGLLAGACVVLLSVLPWAVARVTAEPLLARLWPALSYLAVPGAPLVWLTRRLDVALHRLADRPLPADREGEVNVLETELRTVVAEGEREGLLEREAGRMIRQVIELRDEDIAAVMTPRRKMVTLPESATLEEARDVLLGAGHSRVPVIRETLDDVAGVLYAKDLLRALGNGADPARPVTEVPPRPAVFLPETVPLNTLLRQMKAERTHLALVTDEYGGVAGLVTLEDLLEEIVGDIADEYDPEQRPAIRVVPDPADPASAEIPVAADAPADGAAEPARVFDVDGSVRTDDLNERADLGLPEDDDDFDTVAGFVLSHLKRIPDSGQEFDWNGLHFPVPDARARRIETVRIERRPEPADPAG